MSGILEQEAPEERTESGGKVSSDPTVRDKFCADCGAGPFTLPESGHHAKFCEKSIARRDREKAFKKKEQEEAQGISHPEPEEVQESLYLEEQDPNALLKSLLTKHPGVGEKIVDEVMDWAVLYGQIQPLQLPYLLTSLGVKQTTANIISMKYSLALQKSQANQPMFQFQGMMPQGPAQGMGWGAMPGMGMPQNYQSQPQPQHIWTPMGPMLPPSRPEGERDSKFVTKEDLQKMMDDMKKKSEMDELKDQIKELRNIIQENARSGAAASGPQVLYEEERVPIDSKGNIVSPGEATSVKYRRVPIQQGVQQLGQDSYLMQKLNELGTNFQTLEKRMSDEKIGNLEKKIDELNKPKTEDPQVTAMKTAIQGYATKLDELKDELNQREKEQLADAIADLRSRLDNVSRGDFNQDSMKIVSQGLTGLANVFEKRQPVELVMRTLFPGTMLESGPETVVQPGQGNLAVQDALAKAGLTATLQTQ